MSMLISAVFGLSPSVMAITQAAPEAPYNTYISQAGSSHAVAGIGFAGKAAVDCAGGTCLLAAESICNRGNVFGISGSLRLELWATACEFEGGILRGERIAVLQLGQLRAGQQRRNIAARVPQIGALDAHPHLVMALTMYDSRQMIADGFGVMDYLKLTSAAHR